MLVIPILDNLSARLLSFLYTWVNTIKSNWAISVFACSNKGINLGSFTLYRLFICFITSKLSP